MSLEGGPSLFPGFVVLLVCQFTNFFQCILLFIFSVSLMICGPYRRCCCWSTHSHGPLLVGVSSIFPLVVLVDPITIQAKCINPSLDLIRKV